MQEEQLLAEDVYENACIDDALVRLVQLASNYAPI